MIAISVLFVLLSFIIVSESQLYCKNESNHNVDWFVALKYPKSYDFVYMTPNDARWRSSSENLTSVNNMIAQTIKQSQDPRYLYAYYNDEHPELDSQYSERGHLKGVLNFGQLTGYWFIHSVPKFPSVGSYKYEKGQEEYAQSFICISVDYKNLESFVDQLLMMQSTVYSYNIPNNFSPNGSLMAKLNQFFKNKKTKFSKSNIFQSTTIGKLPFLHFGKANIFKKDLYAELVAPSLRTSIYVESWIRGDKIDSSCSQQYKVYNVHIVDIVNTEFEETRDHSKWAVSTSVDKPFVCIGDINRMTSQFKRGGGTLCLQNLILWRTFNLIVCEYEHCN